MKEAILKLRNEVKQLQFEGRALGEKIRQSKGLERYRLWNVKRSNRDGARYVYLAYACLRGRSYVKLESKVRQGHEPWTSSILDAITKVLDDTQKAEWTAERVKAWLKGESLPKAEETTEVAA